MNGDPNVVVVTGAAGFLGRVVLRLLGSSPGHRVVASVRRPMNLPHPAEVFVGDLTEPDALSRLRSRLGNKEWGLVHLAGGSPGADPERIASRNIDTTLGVLEAAGDTLAWIVHASSVAVYGIEQQRRDPDGLRAAPDSAYGRAKWLAEEALNLFARTSGARVVHLRLASLYGPGNTGASAVAKLTAAVASDEPFVVDPATPVRARDYLHVDDAAGAVVEAARGSASAVLDVGSGVASSPYDLVTAMRSRDQRVRLEDPDGRAVTVPGEVATAFACDLTRTRANLRLPPPKPLADGLADEVAWRVAEKAGLVL